MTFACLEMKLRNCGLAVPCEVAAGAKSERRARRLRKSRHKREPQSTVNAAQTAIIWRYLEGVA